ncbi:hypothetical protein MPDQ_000399 [Monascus purpureus]|uniref:Protein farnesyltransferase subunit beta n=1 Tax=Monascus purpureus TaxID=5098 RepID=A0A507QTW4_MONPU|nr:hypothetical protein MPDQ_000399 [Monascus purpureus]BDD58308.1 hypothetical protein MAP00_003598 [Monascus purpureus]
MASTAASTASKARARVPSLFTQSPLIKDPLVTETSQLQNDTLEACLPFLKGVQEDQKGPFNEHGVPALQRDEHVQFLYDSLEDYPAGFVVMDASRPWMTLWGLSGLSLLGEDVTKYRERVITTFGSMQNSTGGFGGGHGQASHAASSYAALLSLALVGGEEAYKLVDRQAMWKWLGKLKTPEGGFRVCEGGEADVRGVYCAMTIISLLNLPLTLPPEAEARHSGLETFFSGLPEYISRCQTFEGGISGSPGIEAHGAYAFCALASLCIMGAPQEIIHKYLNVPLLLSWLSARQYAPEGGFSGRTNKLVDGCYSHWVGSCWPLLQSALNGVQSAAEPKPLSIDSLCSREGLTRYILSCCQNKKGGLRDKPGKYPDAYHTCYALLGLSTVQYYHYHTDSSAASGDTFASAFSWKAAPIIDGDGSEVNVFDEKDRLTAFHPMYAIPHEAAENMRQWYEKQAFEL